MKLNVPTLVVIVINADLTDISLSWCMMKWWQRMVWPPPPPVMVRPATSLLIIINIFRFLSSDLTWWISRGPWWRPGSRRRWWWRGGGGGRPAGRWRRPALSRGGRPLRCPRNTWRPPLPRSGYGQCRWCCTHPKCINISNNGWSRWKLLTVLKMTGTERRQARNQRDKTAALHFDLERNPTSLNGWTTTMYLK